MISKFVREQKRYTQEELCDIFACDDEKVVSFIRKLKEFGVLKTVKSSDAQKNMAELLDEDIEITDVEVGENEYLYVFTFVGVIIVAGRVLKCYPKYLLSTKEPIGELKKVIKVLQKSNSKEQIVQMFNDGEESSSFNLLAVLLFLLHDFYENGAYSNTEDIIENNGSGEILWDKTINETFTLISNNRPYYTDLQTRKRVNNDFDYFKRLHECILTTASDELKDAGLLDLFELTEVNLTDEELDDFGDKEYVLYRLEKELNTQFNTRKQLVLKTLYAYIDHKGSLYDAEGLSLFGTNSFSLVWEKVCAEVFDNKLKVPLKQLKMSTPLAEKYKARKNDTLLSIIEKPKWKGEYTEEKDAKDTLIPDLINISQVDGCDYFLIFDAKYYNIVLEHNKPLSGQPGIGDVTKQYLYQLAYKEFIKAHNIPIVKNCFLMPTEGKDKINHGVARLPMLEALGLENIQIRQISADMLYDYFLSDQNILIERLKLQDK